MLDRLKPALTFAALWVGAQVAFLFLSSLIFGFEIKITGALLVFIACAVVALTVWAYENTPSDPLEQTEQ